MVGAERENFRNLGHLFRHLSIHVCRGNLVDLPSLERDFLRSVRCNFIDKKTPYKKQKGS